ncbi:tRNA (adenosine(37)-N6)-threonylcarbamoyltransferase complex transferase subunit TsaD [Fimbriiglobus ruber]|uniref:tRNA N6-adenosine threonylcarbamoyltransferase n=1 Tax=Fimbriiglobus ruber TaxID=1908690 RepID=A0A225DK14_9BACT|nr:tRNA (adenosine(37)-N6)-threonylcarbamoyltransferase complex transferase subunit TsaD [Fimbriiglobus ruber]OWK36487.1 TsaD/Kae1/Qri7 protein, required for threonylcarbamoyladenosine t(6)A37 formation in tRNA [Fimbriiglobus ruber]
MYFLGIETSCDETAAAVFTDDLTVLSNVVASQTDLHSRFGGVVPEIAARAHLRNLLPVIDEALVRANVRLADIGCVAVHNTPGLVGALLVGVSGAKMLALSLGVPLIGVNHVAGHIFACRLAAGRDIFPCVGLVVSGGHTALFRNTDPVTMDFLGGTRDDAAGEAFDKVGAILGLGFPGGPAVEREAKTGNPKAFAFPRSFLDDARLEFSFSGLKTAVLYACHGQDVSRATPPPAGQKRADLAASFQEAVVDVLAGKCKHAMRQTGLKRLAVGGGVSANTRLRERLAAMCAKEGAELFIPPMSLCTDNAAMAALAVEKWRRGEFAPPDLDAEPSFL